MAEPMSTLSPEKLNVVANVHDAHNETVLNDDDWHDPPSSPFESDLQDQENVAPTPVKPIMNEEEMPQSAFKIGPEKKFGLKDRSTPVKVAQASAQEDGNSESNTPSRVSTKKTAGPFKQLATEAERPGSSTSSRGSRRSSPSKSPHNSSAESTRLMSSFQSNVLETLSTPSKSQMEDALRENEGLTVAMRDIEAMHSDTKEPSAAYNRALAMEDISMEDTEFGPDGPDDSNIDVDDTCFSTFSEMPGIDMTKFAALRQSPTKSVLLDQATPRARPQGTPSSIRRSNRTPSPTSRRSRKEGDTTNLLLDFTAQFEAFSTSRRGSPSRNRGSPPRSTTEPNLLSYYNSQRSPAKGGSSNVPATPRQSRPLLNLLDFELPPAPTPRSIPTVTIRELESLKSNFQSQISSLTASLSGKEAQVESLVKAISDAERRVGEAQETVREERSAREHAEAQMEDWKKKGEEVQTMMQDIQAQITDSETEREQLVARLAEAEKRAEEAEQRASDLETRAIEAESKNVDMTTFVNHDEDAENKKIYSELECQTAIAEKVNEVARDLHAAYKAKHEKKIKALKESYQKKADERCKELRLDIKNLERQIEEAEKRQQDTFSKVIPDSDSGEKCEFCGQVPQSAPATTSLPSDLKLIEAQTSELNSLKAAVAGLESELSSIRASQASLLRDLEAERIEKGELVAAAEQMLAMCGEKMEEMQQEEFRKSVTGPPSAPASTNPSSLSSSTSSTTAPTRKRSESSDRLAHAAPLPQQQTMRSTGFLAGGPAPTRPGSGIGAPRPVGHERGAHGGSAGGLAKPSGLRAPGGFGLNRSMSGAGKSRLMSNIERMGGTRE